MKYTNTKQLIDKTVENVLSIIKKIALQFWNSTACIQIIPAFSVTSLIKGIQFYKKKPLYVKIIFYFKHFNQVKEMHFKGQHILFFIHLKISKTGLKSITIS